jgi:crotonobetainyl-CoA:carnitine CoA-transferase CaiB-like acyl-CoA transferase
MQRTFLPLVGVRVIDLSHVIAGPFATFQLAQLGAEVLKIEHIDGGDVLRRSAKGPQAFAALNAGKQKVRLDIDAAADRQKIADLARQADVFVDNLRPGALEARGLGFAAIKAINPRIIYCTISGFGMAGSLGGRTAYDHVVQAATGMTMATGNAGDPPTKIAFPLVDVATGLLAALAILAALRERERTGEGRLLDVSLAAAALQLMYPMTCEALTDGRNPARTGNQAFSGSPAADIFAARGGGWIAIAANTPRQMQALLEVLELAHLAGDPTLFERPLVDAEPAGFLRAKNPAAIKAALAARIALLDAAEAEARLGAAKVPAARVRTLAEFAREADRDGTLAALTLEDEGVSVRSPGLGFRVL